MRKYTYLTHEYSKIVSFLYDKEFFLNEVNRHHKAIYHSYTTRYGSLMEYNNLFAGIPFIIGFNPVDFHSIEGKIVFLSQEITFDIGSFTEFESVFRIAEEMREIANIHYNPEKTIPYQKFVFTNNELFVDYPLIQLGRSGCSFRCASIISDKPYFFIVQVHGSNWNDSNYDYFSKSSPDLTFKESVYFEEAMETDNRLTFTLPENFYPSKILVDVRIDGKNRHILDLKTRTATKVS